jgi:enolase
MIKSLRAKLILDSRGKPTVKVELRTEKGVFFASCPSGASTGKNEAVVVKAEEAVANINNIIALGLAGKNEKNQEEIDNFLIKLDGTKNKSKLGANAILPVSMAVCRAGAKTQNLPLYGYINKNYENNLRGFPRPCFNIINGGAHAKNGLSIQEFMVIPREDSFKKNLKVGKKIFKKLRKILKKNLGKDSIKMGDEGGFAPKESDIRKILDFLSQASLKFKAKIGLDCAATQFYKDKKYILGKEKLNKEELLKEYINLVNNYPIIFIEDPFFENDYRGFEKITSDLGSRIIIVGDDFLTTNINRINKAEKSGACNGAIIKPNQIGTVTETLKAVKISQSYGWKIIVSHRSGETMDDFIADLAVGVGADFIKSGAPSRPERLVKYKRLVKIEKELK